MQCAFDAKGRLWVTTSHSYPFPADKPHDKLFILADFAPDGKARKITTFADDLNIPIGVLPLPDGKSVIVSEVGRIVKLTDTDGDGKADKREVLFTGFGTRDTHGMTNSYTAMPDGWIYACHGYLNESRVKGTDGHEVTMQSGHTFRFKADGSRIEIYTRGQVNPFGMTADPWGNLYTADCHSKPITQLIPGAYYDSFGKPHNGLGYAPHVTHHDHGSTALCGLAWYSSDKFPPPYRDNMFLGNVVTNRINRDVITWNGSTPVGTEQQTAIIRAAPHRGNKSRGAVRLKLRTTKLCQSAWVDSKCRNASQEAPVQRSAHSVLAIDHGLQAGASATQSPGGPGLQLRAYLRL